MLSVRQFKKLLYYFIVLKYLNIELLMNFYFFKY